MPDAIDPPLPDLPHAYGFDPTYGYDLPGLLAIEPPPEPPGFAAFWEPTYAEALATPLRIEVSDLPSPHPEFDLRLLRYEGWNGVRLGAWLVTPRGPVSRYVVVGHGYYNRPLEDITYPPGTAALFIASRGLGLSRVAGISDQTAFHVLHGIEDKTTYVHRGCVADVWTGASVMLSLFPQAADRLEYEGESFGGGIGAMALAWDRRYRFGWLRVPSFGHHPLRLTMRCLGSGQAVRRACARRRAIEERTLRFFDAAVHAGRLTMPVAYACARFDPSVPPPGQFAVYDATPGPKCLTIWVAGHHDWPGHAAEVRRAEQDAEAFRRRTLGAAD